jgi:hypothetical protein
MMILIDQKIKEIELHGVFKKNYLSQIGLKNTSIIPCLPILPESIGRKWSGILKETR